MEASEHAARAASTSELAVCCLLCPSVAWIRTPTSDRQLTMPPTPLSSPDHAAKLDAEPLNPATGLTSTRALYEVPKCGPVGADGPAGTLSRPPDLSRGPPSGLAVETSCSRTLCRFGSDRQRDRLHGRQLARSLAPPGARDSQPRARRLVLPVRARPRSICPTHPLVADLSYGLLGCSAVVGHFDHPHGRPWKDIDQTVTAGLAAIVGAEEAEVACTSTLTSNLHNLFVSFYRPEKGEGAKRRKILVEGKAFPSDQVRPAFAAQRSEWGSTG